MEWIGVYERLPEPGRPVLAHYLNRLGKHRIIKAMHAPHMTLETSPESEDADYDESREIYVYPEGWYELIDNWDDFSSVGCDGIRITHWMPLPPPPTEGGD